MQPSFAERPSPSRCMLLHRDLGRTHRPRATEVVHLAGAGCRTLRFSGCGFWGHSPRLPEDFALIFRSPPLRLGARTTLRSAETKLILTLRFSAWATLVSVLRVTFFGELSILDILEAFIPARAASSVWFIFKDCRSRAIRIPTSSSATSCSTRFLKAGSFICRAM